jgi:HEAT repeat protein
MKAMWFNGPPIPRRGFVLQPRVAALRGYPGALSRAKSSATPTGLRRARRWRNSVGVLVSRIASVVLLTFLLITGRSLAADDSGKTVQLVLDLLTDKDKDIRALGLQQVREEAKGEAATKQFAEMLPKLAPDAQVGLINALADRGDSAARPAVVEMLKSADESVRTAVLHALGTLGTADDAPVLIRVFSGVAGPGKEAARDSLTRMTGDAASSAIAAALAPASPPPVRAELIAVLATRHAAVAVPSILTAAEDSDPKVRTAAMAALAELAGPEQVPGMVRGVLKAAPGPEREAAERAVAAVLTRIEDPAKRAEPLLAVMSKRDSSEYTAMLPTLGRVGGPGALTVVEAAIAESNPRRHAAGIRALCNWPDATVAAKLESMTQATRDPSERTQLLRALIRVAALHDKRTDAERLALLKRSMELTTNDDERNAVVKRCRSIRTIESLRYLVPYLDDPALAQETCASVVELAHHKELREPNRPEFVRALDIVIRIGKDPDVVDHAQRYKKGET